MPKKRQPEPDPFVGLLPTPPPRPGRRPKIPPSLKECFADLDEHTTAWLRRFHDVWFNGSTGLDWANGATTTEGVAEEYDHAIELLQVLAKAAKDGVVGLKKGKARAAEACEGKGKARGRKPSRPKPRTPPKQTDYFGLEKES